MICIPGHAANNPKAVVPWSALQQDPEKFLEPRYLPDGVQLQEVSKMKAASLNACVSHWLERVESGQRAFRFKAVDDAHRRDGKAKKKRRNPSSDDENEAGGSRRQGQTAKRKRQEPPSEDEGEDDAKSRKRTDGSESDQDSSADVGKAVPKVTGKGKDKAAIQIWYDFDIYLVSQQITLHQ